MLTSEYNPLRCRRLIRRGRGSLPVTHKMFGTVMLTARTREWWDGGDGSVNRDAPAKLKDAVGSACKIRYSPSCIVWLLAQALDVQCFLDCGFDRRWVRRGSEGRIQGRDLQPQPSYPKSKTALHTRTGWQLEEWMASRSSVLFCRPFQFCARTPHPQSPVGYICYCRCLRRWWQCQ